MPDRLRFGDEVIPAWRTWKAYVDGSMRPMAWSGIRDWLPGQRAVSRCPKTLKYAGLACTSENTPISPPCPSTPHCINTQCSCGLHAWKERGRALSEFSRSVRTAPSPRFTPHIWTFVFGRVNLWGTIYEHQHGYRAQYAYPDVLWVCGPVGHAWAPTLRRTWGVEVGELDEDVIRSPQVGLGQATGEYDGIL